MKKIIQSFVFVFGVLSIHAECFTTQIYFEDKDGNKDTLTIGVSENISECELQTDTWSEEDALSALTNGRHWAWFGYSVANNCPCAPHRIHINPPTTGHIESGKIHIWYPQDRLPVAVHWNKDDFADISRSKSLFCDMASWFDAVCNEESNFAFANETSTMQFLTKQYCNNIVKLQDTRIETNYLGFAFCSEEMWKKYTDNKYVISSEQKSRPRLILENGMLYIIINGEKKYSIIGM